ncbi:cellulase family glycosylhydrolase [Segatella baroniae]|uniref:cellulase family glycosylhydrolase n=1 Tax=Segatella baroniae TaxID=305719 RepID=UPI0004046BE9|nr:cellulase family glycosylhydrolase [Segatella baroniae]
MMKKRLSIVSMLVMVFTMISLVSCSKEETISGGGISTSFQVSKSALQFSKTGGETYLYVESPTQPVVLSDQSWLVVSQDLSNSARVYKYKVAAATNTDTNDRTASISVSSGSEQVTVPVNQVSTEGLIIETASFEVSADGGSITVKLKANGEYDVTTPSWIAQADNSTRANMQDYEEVFTIEANISPLARTGQISFTRGDIVESVTVNQAAGQVEANMDRTAKELAKAMYPGWNLGNTMEAGDMANNFTNAGGLGAETAWQSTQTTKALIDFVKAQGFKSVRIPTSWVMGHITDAENMTIDPAWLARVKEIVDYCISDGLYVFINDHWDGGWIEVEGFSKTSSSYEAVDETIIADKVNKLKKLWTNIATYFKDYNEYLMFAGLNEPFQEYSLFSTRHSELTPILERYNQAFVDAVRATGGNNAKRVLIVQGPSTNISSTVNYFNMPTDTENGKLMVEVHYYEPWDFCGSNATKDWNADASLKTSFESLKTKFVNHDIPVVIGEYGANWQENTESHNDAIRRFFKSVVENAGNCGIVPFAWDINVVSYPNMSIINRTGLSVWNTPAMTGITEGVAAAQWPY